MYKLLFTVLLIAVVVSACSEQGYYAEFEDGSQTIIRGFSYCELQNTVVFCWKKEHRELPDFILEGVVRLEEN